MQSIIGKRKDARHSSGSNIADPETLARRHILRPRNPTPSQRRQQELQLEIMEATQAFMKTSPRMNTIREQVDSPLPRGSSGEVAQAKVVAGEVAAFSVRLKQGMRDDSRKRSVTTQDFLDEAMKIMDFIRNNGRPTSGMGSLEETDSENQQDNSRELYPSSALSLSRPPTREGRESGWRSNATEALDPRIASHLNRFKDKEGESFMGSSVRSIHVADTEATGTHHAELPVVESSPANIRIRVHAARNGHARTNSDNSQQDGLASTGSQPQTHSSQTSTDSSIGRTLNTNSSRRSEKVATLAPSTVAHLIPEEVGGMSFDKEKGVWVRSKSLSPRKERGIKSPGGASQVTQSDEDPFGNIPDLTVDEMKEQDRIEQQSPSRKATDIQIANGIDALDQEIEASSRLQVGHGVGEDQHSRPSTRDDTVHRPTEASSLPTRFSSLASSGPQPGARATSVSASGTVRSKKEVNGTTTVRNKCVKGASADVVEHEIKIDESRVQAKCISTLGKLVISVSSPATRRTQRNGSRTYSQPAQQNEQDDGKLPAAREIAKKDNPFHARVQTLRGPSDGWPHGRSALPRSDIQRRQSLGLSKPAFPQIDEDNELSMVVHSRDQRQMSLSLHVSAHPHNTLVVQPSSPPANGDLTFYLSELPDFTVHQVDERELPDRSLVKRGGTHQLHKCEDRFEQGNNALVKALQDVEPEEPYWEDLRQVDLHDQALTSLHLLDLFCDRAEVVDVADNTVAQLNGAPATIRSLNVARNCLTSLTNWGHLMNLQYLDVSGNDIDNLGGLACLVHLRELKADNNKIERLDGIHQLDGLLSLSVRGNRLGVVDFEYTGL